MKYPVLVNKKTGRYASIPDRELLALQAEAEALNRGEGAGGVLSLLVPPNPKARNRLRKILKTNEIVFRPRRGASGIREASERIRLLIDEKDRILASLAELFLKETEQTNLKITIFNFVRWAKKRLLQTDTSIRQVISESHMREELSARSIDWWKARIAERRRKTRVSRRI